MSIVINTPTSNIGRARGVEGSFEEPALLAKALEGAEPLFWLTPPPVHRRAATATSSERARRHAVPHEAEAPTSSEEQK